LLLGLFGLYFNEIIILNEKFLLLVIFILFFFILKTVVLTSIDKVFGDLKKELLNEIFLYEFSIDAMYSLVYSFFNLDLFRKKLFLKVYLMYIQGLCLTSVFYYNFSNAKETAVTIDALETVVNDVYYFIMKKHLFMKLNFLYRSYYYIFYKFRVI